MSRDTLERVQRLKPLAAEAGLSLAQMAVAWVLQNPAFASVVIGASHPSQVSSNVEASGVVLESALLDRIDEILGPAIERSQDQVAAMTPK